MRTTLPGLLALLLIQPAQAQAVSSPPATLPEVPRATGPITIDGKLDEAVWQKALKLGLPYNTRPGENTPAPVRTEAFLSYDDQYFYVAFKAYDPQPENIRAHYTDRDSAYNDDFIGVVVDTFNDERGAYEFFANPLGAQMDLYLNDVGGGESDAFNAIWSSSGRITDFGYVVEMAIPLRALRFPAGKGEMIWNIDLVRFWPREHRYRLALHPMDKNRNCYLCQGVKVRGFSGVDPGNNVLLTPTLTASRTDSRADYSAPLVQGDVDVEAGVTAEWGITPNITLSGTINPDFSQIEADVAQLDVNNRFALFYPERRSFFLEGADYFQTPLDIIYTRNIANPDWGAKVTGKEGAHAFGVFATDDQITNLLFPGSQNSEFGSFAIESQTQAARYRYDVSDGYTLGGVFTSRAGEGYENTVVGADGVLRFTDTDALVFQALQSRTRYNQAMQAEFGVPAGTLQDEAYVILYEHDTRSYSVEGQYINIGEEFRADLGFIPQVGYAESSVSGQYRWYGEEQDWYNEYGLGGEWDITHDTDGQVLEREVKASVYLQAGMQSFVELTALAQDVLYNGVLFDQSRGSLFAEIRPSGLLYANVFIEAGDGIDFANTRPGDLLHAETDLNLRLGRHLHTEISYTYEQLDVAGGRLYTARLSDFRLAWYFNLQMYVRLIAQHQKLARNPALYNDAVDSLSRNLATQLLFSYKLNPQTVFYAGYSNGYIGDAQRSLQQMQRTLFLKFSYAWQL
ncbi:MAG TPA: DUF5916 domain-containing protein [Gammaproteobacteria bacterium]|nr:DUF5916 domain-containing protein [Gammaproteobacteria bacterium]